MTSYGFATWRQPPLTTASSFVYVDVSAFSRSKSISKPNLVNICPFMAVFGLEKQTSAIWEFYFRFRSRPFPRNLHIIVHQATEFRPNRSPYCGNMMSYPCIKMALAAAQYYFRFRICWCHCLQKVKVYQQTKFRRHILIDGWDIITSVFEKKKRPPYWNSTSGFYIYHFFRNLRVILHQATEFCQNRSTHCGNMTSYLFLKMAAAAAQYYFRFRICWCRRLQKVKVYQQTKFCRHISIHGCDITTSGLEKQTSAVLEFYLRLRSLPFFRNLRYSTSGYRILSKSEHPLRKYDIMSICQDGGRSILLPVSYLLMSPPSESQVYQQTKFRQHNLNSRLPYNYFWFGKTNVRHFGILLPVSISTIFFRNLRYSASGYRILSKSEHPLRKYDVISIFQDGGRGRSILLPVSYLLMSLSTSTSKPNFVHISLFTVEI